MSYEGERLDFVLSCVESLDAEQGIEMPEPHAMPDERQYRGNLHRDDAEDSE
jgi:hypothetical protein